jgi:diaminobutyrate-2-oxoglutarate transaminase
MVGIELADGETAARLVGRAFEDGLLLEACGPHGRVLKLLPPLTTPDGALLEAIEIVERGLTSERGSVA